METDDIQAERDFLLAEVEQVRKTYEEFIEETRRLERYAILVAGTTWGWCASHVDSYAFSLFIWFPAVACGLFGLRAFGIHTQSLAARRYIAKIESVFVLSGHTGWAKFQIAQSKGLPAVVALTAYIFWIILTLVTIGIPLIFHARMHL
jgi:hypothetical protein